MLITESCFSTAAPATSSCSTSVVVISNLLPSHPAAAHARRGWRAAGPGCVCGSLARIGFAHDKLITGVQRARQHLHHRRVHVVAKAARNLYRNQILSAFELPHDGLQRLAPLARGLNTVRRIE